MPSCQLPAVTPKRKAWSKDRLIGQKRPLLPKQVWAIRARLELAGKLRDVALFNFAIDAQYVIWASNSQMRCALPRKSTYEGWTGGKRRSHSFTGHIWIVALG